MKPIVQQLVISKLETEPPPEEKLVPLQSQIVIKIESIKIKQMPENEINKYLDRIKPGGIFFKSDADAASAFKGLADQGDIEERLGLMVDRLFL